MHLYIRACGDGTRSTLGAKADGTCERGVEVVDSERTDFQVDVGDATCGNEVRLKANMHKRGRKEGE